MFSTTILLLSLIQASRELEPGSCSVISCVYPSRCFSNNLGTAYCMAPVSQSATTSTIGWTTSGFYFDTNSTQLQPLVINVCYNQSVPREYNLIKLTLTNGYGISNFRPFVVYTTPINPGCSSFKTGSLNLSNSEPGISEDLLILMTSSAPLNLQVTVEIWIGTDASTSSFTPVMIGIGTSFLIVLLAILAWLIYKKCVTQESQLETAEVPPSQADLQLNLHLDKYLPTLPFQTLRQSSNIKQVQVNCTVCLVDILGSDLVRSSPCGHVFHQECLDLWCSKSLNCPLCRFPLDTESLSRMSLNISMAYNQKRDINQTGAVILRSQ